MQDLLRSGRMQVRRRATRGAYDRETVYAILDEGLVCHVGFVDGGAPFVIPTGYARVEDRLILHGATASRMMQRLAAGAEACVTVTLLDGLVLAKSAFHHSMNYRSVVVMGRGEIVTGEQEKMIALQQMTERMVPGRWAEVRWPIEKELRATTVISLPISEASAKIRTGPPGAEEEPFEGTVWTGVLPLRQVRGEAVPTEEARGMELPGYLRSYRRGK